MFNPFISWEVFALLVWIIFGFGCLFVCLRACATSEDDEIDPRSGGQEQLMRGHNEYAVIIDPTGSIRVGVKKLLASGMHRISSIGSSLSRNRATAENNRLLSSAPDSSVGAVESLP